MDEREVRSKSDALQKAVAAKEPAANILNILNDLKSNVKPSEELLRKTQVGRVVNRLKAMPGLDERIPRLASEIVLKWRNEVQSKKGPTNGGATPTRNGNSSPAPAMVKTASTASDSVKTPKSDGTHNGVPLDKRTWKMDKLSRSEIHSDPQRAISIGLMYDGLVIGSAMASSEVLVKACAIESAIIALPDANGSNTSDFYKDKIRSLYQNLKNKANPELRAKLLRGDIAPDRFAVMTHDEMKSESQKKEEEKIAKENLSNAMAPQEERSISDYMECGKCKQKKVSFTQAQTRSADEPMTTFCKCENCGHRWKFS